MYPSVDSQSKLQYSTVRLSRRKTAASVGRLVTRLQPEPSLGEELPSLYKTTASRLPKLFRISEEGASDEWHQLAHYKKQRPKDSDGTCVGCCERYWGIRGPTGGRTQGGLLSAVCSTDTQKPAPADLRIGSSERSKAVSETDNKGPCCSVQYKPKRDARLQAGSGTYRSSSRTTSGRAQRKDLMS